MTRAQVFQKQGFSYIELLVSLFIISSGFIAYTELIIWVRSTQQNLITEFQHSLAMDFKAQAVIIQQGFCKPGND
jgi:type II secretory pathway pseudopilin PulG